MHSIQISGHGHYAVLLQIKNRLLRLNDRLTKQKRCFRILIRLISRKIFNTYFINNYSEYKIQQEFINSFF